MNIPERATTSGVIYVTENLVNGKIYVGLDTKGSPNYLGSGFAVNRAIRKYGRAAFCRHDVDSFRSAAEGFLRERFWIRKLHSRSDTGWGYNLTDGGEGGTGRRVSPETRQKISEARMGHGCSGDTRRKISEALRGRKHTAEARQKMSMSQKGKQHFLGFKHTEESRRKMSAAKQGLAPWNKGKKCPATSAALMGRTPWNKDKKRPADSERAKAWWRELKTNPGQYEEHCRKISDAKKGKGKPWSPARRTAWEEKENARA